MDEFEKDRKIENEIYAIVNYFKLLKQAETAELDTYDSRYSPEDTFKLIGGVDSFDKLLIDYQNGNIDIFSNSTGQLFTKLNDKINYINNIPFSKHVLLNNAINSFELIKKFYSEVYSVNGNSNEAAVYDLIVSLPLSRSIKFEMLKLKPKEKTLGER